MPDYLPKRKLIRRKAVADTLQFDNLQTGYLQSRSSPRHSLIITECLWNTHLYFYSFLRPTSTTKAMHLVMYQIITISYIIIERPITIPSFQSPVNCEYPVLFSPEEIFVQPIKFTVQTAKPTFKDSSRGNADAFLDKLFASINDNADLMNLFEPLVLPDVDVGIGTVKKVCNIYWYILKAYTSFRDWLW